MDWDRGRLMLSVGAVLIVAVAAGGFVPWDTDFIHREEPASDEFNASQEGHLHYENLSDRGRTIVDRTIERGEYAVEDESETVPEFEYPNHEIQYGTGWYVIQRDGRAYEITTTSDRSSLFSGLLTIFVFPLLALLGIALCVSGVLLRFRPEAD